MGNEESLPTEKRNIDTVIYAEKVKADLIKERPAKNSENTRKMSMGLLQKLPLFSYPSEGGGGGGGAAGKKELSDNYSISSDELLSEDSPVTPPGPDLSHLSDSEREHIAKVIARAKNIERDEDERLREIENELNFIEEAASSRSSKHSLTSDGNHCSICSKSVVQTEKSVELSCVNCGRKVCNECGMYNSDPGSTFADLLCSICQKKRHLILSSGMWFHGLCHDPFPKTLSIQDLLQSPQKPKIERTASYSQYEDIFGRANKTQEDLKPPKRTSLPCNKLKSSSVHHNSTPEIRNLIRQQQDDQLENEMNNDSYIHEINPEYQEVKNRYLQDSNFGKLKSRRQILQTQSSDVKCSGASEFIDSQETSMYNIPFQRMPNYVGFTDSDREISHYNDYKQNDDYNFPLVDDILNSSMSSDDEDYATYEKNPYFQTSDSNYNPEMEFPLLEDVLNEVESPNQNSQVIRETNLNIIEPNYPNYSSSTFKPNCNFNKETENQNTYDNFDRYNSLLTYYDQCEEDYFYTEDEFRAIENFQLYNNELIRRSLNEENFFNRAIEQSDTDSDIAKFAATVASDTAHLTSQTFNYDEMLSNSTDNRFTFEDVDKEKVEELEQDSDVRTDFAPALLNTEQYTFKKSVLSPIPDLSPNSSRADEVNINQPEVVYSQSKRELIECDHDSDEECAWCYRDSSSYVSKDNNFSSSISSSPLSSKSSSSSTLSTSNETINNKSKSQLKRCQNYENISGLSESASADTLEDNNSIQEIGNDDHPDTSSQSVKQAEFTKSQSLSRQQSVDITTFDLCKKDENEETLSQTCPQEFPTNTSLSYNQSAGAPVPSTDLVTSTIDKVFQEKKYNEDRNINSLFIPSETITPKFSKQTHSLSAPSPIGKYVTISKNLPIFNRISDIREANFSCSSASEIANQQFHEQATQETSLSTSTPNKKALEKFTAYTDYHRTVKNSILNKVCVQLQVPIQTRNRKSLVNEEILLVTQINRQHLKDFVQIQNVELQLNYLRIIEKQQMTEIQEKMAEIQNAKSVLSYPRLSKSRYVPNYAPNVDNNYYYYVPQRNHYRYPYPQYYYQNPYPYRQDHMYKYDPVFDDQRSSYSIHSSPQCLNYGGSYPRELKYNTYYYVDPSHNGPRTFSRSTDQIAMHNNYPNYPMELSHSDQGLFNMAYNYPIKVNDRFAFNIDIELMQKEQRVLELEREIELRKRQIEETIRYQEELLQLAELNNVNVNDYKNSYIQPNSQKMADYDIVNDYYISDKPQSTRQHPDELMGLYYPYEELPPNHQQFASYYDNLYQQNEPKDSICYADPSFQQDPYYPQEYVPNIDTTNIYGKKQDVEMVNSFDQHQPRYSSKSYPSENRTGTNNLTQEQLDYVIQMEKEVDVGHNGKGSYKTIRPLSGEYENVVPADNFDGESKEQKSALVKKHNSKKSDSGKSIKNYNFPTKRLLLMRDSKEKNLRGNGVGMRIIGGQLCSDGHLGAFVEQIFPGSVADRLQDQIKEGDELIEWNGVSLVGKTFEEVRSILKNDSDEIEFLVRVGSVSKSLDNSKENSDTVEETSLKGTTTEFEHMTLKDVSSPTQTQKNTHKIEEGMPHNSSCDTATDRRSQSIKRQRAQEYELANSTQNAQKSPIKNAPIIESTHDELDCGSPSVMPFESTNNAIVPVKPRRTSNEVTEKNPETEKDENEDKGASEADKLLGEVQLIITFDDYDQSLTVHVAKAKNMLPMDLNGLADPFVKVRLHPDPTEDPDFNRQTRYMANTLNPEWQQTVVFMNILKRSLRKRVLDLSVWDFDRLKSNDFMGQALISLANKQVLDGKPHWYKLTEMKEVDIPGLRQPAHRKVESKNSGKSKSSSKSPKEIKNSRDESVNLPNSAYISNISSDFPLNLPNSNSNLPIQSQLPDIKISRSIEPANLINSRPIRSPHHASPAKINNLIRTDTADSKSSNSSSVTTDFLSEEQREIVRKWLGPGQLLMLSYTQRVDKVGNLPDDSLVIAELFLSLKKIADEDILIVKANSLKNLKSKNITEVYIKLYLMNSEQQLSRVMKRKTKPIILNEDSNFNESFSFTTQLEGMLLQVSLWSCGKGLNVHKMLGEAVIHLDDIEFVKRNSKKDVSGWYKLLKPDI